MTENKILKTGLKIDDLQDRYPLVRKVPEDPRARIRSSFVVAGPELVESTFSRIAGVNPTEFRPERTRGRWIPSGQPNVLPPEWVFEVVMEPHDDVDSCLVVLIDQLFPRAFEVAQFVGNNTFSAGFNTDITVYEEAPLCSLSAETLSKLACFGVEWSLAIQ